MLLSHLQASQSDILQLRAAIQQRGRWGEGTAAEVKVAPGEKDKKASRKKRERSSSSSSESEGESAGGGS
eukprot:1702839-Pleurochrysis_carterae.AAC.1